MKLRKILFALLFMIQCLNVNAQKGVRTENEVPPYTLPNVLKMENGKIVETVKEWERIRRPEVLSLFEEHVYGKILKNDSAIRFKLNSVDKNALNGMATRKEITIFLSGDSTRPLHLLIFLPNNRTRAVPVFAGLNFAGNQTINDDKGITISKKWTRYKNQPGFDSLGFATELSRGKFSSRWPVKEIISRGYGLATAYYGDLQSDRKDVDSLQESFHKWFYHNNNIRVSDNEAGAIGIWAWGLSRIMDYLLQEKDVDGNKIAVIGHSRLGKAAVWAAAQDRRFAMAISNNSGEGGASISRRKMGENIEVMNTAFPHWFSNNFNKYNNKEDALPVDFHELMALIAPRPLYVASASADLWADPKGEYLSLYHAGPVYKLYGKSVFASSEPPAIDQPIHSGLIAYHNRTGKHNITLYDWARYLDFADLCFNK